MVGRGGPTEAGLGKARQRLANTWPCGTARHTCRSYRYAPARRRLFLVLGNAAAQRLHEIGHSLRSGKRQLALLDGAGLFGLSVREQRLLVAVAEAFRVEVANLAL